jgi:hypothetical protein
MVAAGLLGEGRDRAGAVLAEPDGCARRAHGDTANSEQLQHGFAAGESVRRLRRLLVICGHGEPPGQILIR